MVGILCFATAFLKFPKIELTERDLEGRIEHNGYSRYFLVHLPDNHKEDRELPLVIALHGGGGRAKAMLRLTLGRFNELADEHGFIVVYPQGLKRSWNDDRTDPISFAHENNIDDTGFMEKIIDRMIEENHADPSNVFVTGISNGGFMSLRISRELAHRIKAIAPVTASVPLEAKQVYLDAPPINIIIINGVNDPFVPFGGGYLSAFNKDRGEILSTDETVDVFLKRNGCIDSVDIEELEDIAPEDRTRVVRYDYSNCDSSKRVVMLKVECGGHTWPGGWQYLREGVVGKTSRDINACEEIWSFFDSFIPMK